MVILNMLKFMCEDAKYYIRTGKTVEHMSYDYFLQPQKYGGSTTEGQIQNALNLMDSKKKIIEFYDSVVVQNEQELREALRKKQEKSTKQTLVHKFTYDYFLDPNSYGNATLGDLESRIVDAAKLLKNGASIRFDDGRDVKTERELRKAIEDKKATSQK